MGAIANGFQEIEQGFHNPGLYTSTLVTVLLMVLVLAVYEFVVYRLVSHRAFYNRSFNISIAVVPFFIATIILCLQSSLVITLGTIGALAIIRFRTAIKDPVDMVYLLWSIHIGITCGCQTYQVAVLTSIIVTLVLLVMENVKFGKKPLVLVANLVGESIEKEEEKLMGALKECGARFRIKSRNYTEKGLNIVVEVSVKDSAALSTAMQRTGIKRFSLMEYDSDDLL